MQKNALLVVSSNPNDPHPIEARIIVNGLEILAEVPIQVNYRLKDYLLKITRVRMKAFFLRTIGHNDKVSGWKIIIFH